MNRFAAGAALGATLLLGACKKAEPPPLYEAVPVARRDITVAAEAAGTIEPITVVEVKSKASGEIMMLQAETGDIVNQGDLLVQVDPREPRNSVAQAEADLEVARAQLNTAESQKRRSDQMFQSQLVSEQEYEQANLQFANARAQLVRAERSLQTAQDQLDDTNVRAPITGTIIQKNVERGQVITSATREVSGGTVLLRMADLNVVQVRTLVDETDIGKIQPGMRANITVDAYPNRPFEGSVLKIEPQSTTNQNVTMFPVLIRIGNEQGLLRPGMNAEVEIQVAQRTNVLAIPNAALRTQRDVASAAQVLGLNPDEVQQTLARADSIAGPQRQQNPQGGGAQTSTLGGSTNGDGPSRPAQPRGDAVPAAPGGAPQPAMGPGAPGGMQMQLPAGVTQEQAMAVFTKRRNNEPLTAEDSAVLRRIREFRQQQGGGQGGQGGPGGSPGGGPAGAAPAGATATAAPGGQGGGMTSMLPPGVTEERARSIMTRGFTGGQLSAEERAIFNQIRSRFAQGGSQRRRFGAGNNFQFGGSYIVFTLKDGQPTPVRIRTGVTDLDHSEVVSGLTEQDTILLLPSASLVQSQQEMRDRFQRMGGGGVPGMRQQTPTTTPRAGTGGAGGPPAR